MEKSSTRFSRCCRSVGEGLRVSLMKKGNSIFIFFGTGQSRIGLNYVITPVYRKVCEFLHLPSGPSHFHFLMALAFPSRNEEAERWRKRNLERMTRSANDFPVRFRS